MRALVCLFVCLTVTAAAEPTGSVAGKVGVRETDGKPSRDALVVIYLVGFTETPPKPGAVAATIEQSNRRFVPDLVAITVGESVQFPNRDPLIHNVFSPSKVRKFDLGSFKRGETKSRTFDATGVIDVFCNIHVEMAATVLVLPNRAHTLVRPDGTYRLDGLPPGTWDVFAYARRMTKPASAKVTITAGGVATADFALVRGPEPPHDNKFGEDYEGYKK
jgi:plastocyanin